MLAQRVQLTGISEGNTHIQRREVVYEVSHLDVDSRKRGIRRLSVRSRTS